MMWKDLFGKKKKKITHPNHKKRGRWYTQKEVEQYKDGKLIAIYNSACEVQRTLGYAKGHIVECCNGKRRTAYGYEWKYMSYNYLSYEERCERAIKIIKSYNIGKYDYTIPQIGIIELMDVLGGKPWK